MGAKNDGMRNICESLVNVVKVYRPKVLSGLNQTVRGMVLSVRMSLNAVYYSPGGQADANPSGKMSGTW